MTLGLRQTFELLPVSMNHKCGNKPNPNKTLAFICCLCVWNMAWSLRFSCCWSFIFLIIQNRIIKKKIWSSITGLYFTQAWGNITSLFPIITMQLTKNTCTCHQHPQKWDRFYQEKNKSPHDLTVLGQPFVITNYDRTLPRSIHNRKIQTQGQDERTVLGFPSSSFIHEDSSRKNEDSMPYSTHTSSK